MYCGNQGKALCWEIQIEMFSVLCTLACRNKGQIYAGFAPVVGGDVLEKTVMPPATAAARHLCNSQPSLVVLCQCNGRINKREIHAYTVLVKNREEKNQLEVCEQLWVLFMYL